MNLNEENIDELMFQLIEGEIQGEERQRLLDAINADKEYCKQWKAWQQTILNPYDEMLAMNTSKLLKKENKKVVLWWKLAVAAVLVLGVSVLLYTLNLKNDPGMVQHDGPLKNKTQINKVPSISPVKPVSKDQDTVLTLKQKVKMMVLKPEPVKTYVEIVNKVDNQRNEQPIIVEQSQENGIKKIQIPQIEPEHKEKVVMPVVHTEIANNDGVIMTVYSENTHDDRVSTVTSKIVEKRNLLSRIFSVPNIKIVNDSNTYTNRKIILENKAYKIIAGF